MFIADQHEMQNVNNANQIHDIPQGNYVCTYKYIRYAT